MLRHTISAVAIPIAAKTDFASGANPYQIAIGDLDGDGNADITVTNYLSNTISILKNTSNPGNISFDPKADISTRGYHFRFQILKTRVTCNAKRAYI